MWRCLFRSFPAYRSAEIPTSVRNPRVCCIWRMVPLSRSGISELAKTLLYFLKILQEICCFTPSAWRLLRQNLYGLYRDKYVASISVIYFFKFYIIINSPFSIQSWPGRWLQIAVYSILSRALIANSCVFNPTHSADCKQPFIQSHAWRWMQWAI